MKYFLLENITAIFKERNRFICVDFKNSVYFMYILNVLDKTNDETRYNLNIYGSRLF